MEKLNLNLAMAVAQEYDLTVIGPSGCKRWLPNSISVIEVPNRILPLFLLRALFHACREARLGVDLVLAGSGLTGPIALISGAQAGALRGAYVHGLDIIAPSFIYQRVWLPLLRRLDFALANSRFTADLASRAGVAQGRIRIVHPGTEQGVAGGNTPHQFRAKYGLGSSRIMLSVGRLTERKGLREFVLESMPAICKAAPDAVLVVVGNEAPHALHGAGIGGHAELLRLASSIGLQDRVVIVGECDDQELQEAYQSSAVHVFPVKILPGNVEGFGMVAIEAAAQGLQTVAFSVGGVPDAVSPGQSGILVSPGDYATFADEVIKQLARQDDPALANSARSFARRFTWGIFAENIRNALREVSEGGGELTGQKSHAVLDLQSRRLKAKKIEAILNLTNDSIAPRILEVGTGSGGIAHYFATHPQIKCAVSAADVEDNRLVHAGFDFSLITTNRLPYEDNAFDVVISNHVIEHVGEAEAQLNHLCEIRRVLSPQGQCYLAAPNRWQIVEPHYRLAFLSWLPPSLRTRYLRLRKRGIEYDCWPRSSTELESLFAKAGLSFETVHVRALALTYSIENPESIFYRTILRHVPDGFWTKLKPAFPTLIYTLRPASD